MSALRSRISIREELIKPLTPDEQKALQDAQDLMPIRVVHKTILQLEEILNRYRAKKDGNPETLQFYENALKLLILGTEVDGLARYYRREYLEAKDLLKYFMTRCKDLEEQLLELNSLHLAEARLSVGVLDDHLRERIKEMRSLING